MRKRSYPQNLARTNTMEANASVSWRSVFLIIVCVTILAAGFFFAARQHFSAMEFGINNSRLRKQVEDLNAENRRLQLAREVVRSPGEVMRLARVRGYESRIENAALAVVPAKAVAAPAQVVKTAVSEPAKVSAASLPTVKSTVISKPAKRVETRKESKTKVDGNLIARLRQVPE